MKRKGIWAAVAAFCATAFSPALADRTISENTKLEQDADWSGDGVITIAEGVTLDLNGYSLKVAAIDGEGSIVDSAAAALASAGYERLEYIASDSQAQYIDTEDSHNASTIVDMRVQFNTIASQFQAFYGARTGGNSSQFGGWVNYAQFRYGYGGNSASNYNAPVVDTTTIYDVHLEKSGQCTVVTNGVTADVFKIGSGNGDNTTLGLTDFLFAINQDPTNSSTIKHAQWHANAKIYSCVIQKNGGIAHNFIPAKRLSDGAIGMYDSETGKFHVSGNGKAFVAGGAKPSRLRLLPGAGGYALDFSSSSLTVDDNVVVSLAETGALSADCDLRKFPKVEIEKGVAVDLAGHNMTVANITGEGVVLDSEYQLLEYIEAAGAQVIDTTLVPDANTKVDAVFTLTILGDKTIFGTKWGSSGFLAFCSNANDFYALFDTKVARANGATFSMGTRYRLTVESGNVVIKNDDTGVTVGTASSVNMSGGDLTLSICGTSVATKRMYGYCKIYSFQIWQSGELLYDFVPARENATGKIGLWNKVEGKMYASASETPFVAGPLVQGGTPNGELRIAVPEDETVSLGDMAEIAGTVKVLKTGAGTLTLPASGQYFIGGLEVADGTLSMTQTPGWMTNATVSATAGGTIAIAAANGASYANDFTLAGGTLKVLASGTGDTTTATIAGTLALETGAENAQPVVSIDTTDCTSPTFQLTTTALTVGTGVTAAPGFVAISDATFEVRIENGASIVAEKLSAPVTAVWTGEEDDNFDNAANWTCYNKNGAALPATTLPDSSTTTYRLDTDADWTAKGAIALGAGVVLDLAGHNLTATSITGAGVVIDSSDNFITASDGSVYQKIQYVQATQDGANNSGGLGKIQYVDTEYYHIGTTKVDIRVEFQDVSYSGNYGYATYYGCRQLDDANRAAQLGGWLHSDKFFYYDTSEHDGSTAYTGRIYDIRLDKGGSSYANYADGTRAASLGTGNGAGESNTYGTDYIFANNQTLNGGKYWPCKCRVYSCKIYTGDTPERDFVPVRCVSGTNAGEAGFWCNVTKKFYGNSGYGSLTAGPAVQSETAGELHVTVAENATASLGGMAVIAGNVKVVKDGAGTLTLPADGQYFAGGLEVAAGTLSMTQTAKFLAGTPIVVTAGATIFIPASDGASYTNDFTLAGGTLNVLASGSGTTTTATIAGTLALELGANDAQPVVSIDMTDCSSATFVLNTTALTAGTGVTAAPGFVSLADTTTFEASVDGASVKVERLTSPAIAVWTGRGVAGDFDDPDNWSCSNKNGVALSNTTLPDLSGSTLTFRLGTDADWTAKGAIALGEGVTLDLNGRTLTAASITGDGVVTDTSADNVIVADDGSMYQKIKYVQATQDGASNSAQDKIQYVDTEYYHVGTTKVDIRVEFQDVSYSGNYGYAVYYGCRDQNNYKTAQLGGWLHNSKFYYYDTSEHDGSTAYTGRIYDIRLDKGGSSYANYEDGTLASTLGTGNGVGSSNTYGTDYIFANNQVPNGGKYWPCKCRVYSCKVYTGNTLERDFVPVRCISGANAGKAGFWCNVTEKFYGNSGYGNLTAGPLVQGEASGGELHITVAENATLSLANTAKIAGNVKIVKDGLGTLVAPTTGHYFVGGIDVIAGTLSMGGALAYGGAINAASGTTVSVPKSVGSAGTSVVNIAGGTLDVANCGTSAVNGTVTLSGGAIAVSGSFAPVSGTAAHSITLADGATLDFTQWTGEFPAAYPALSFASGANIAVKLEPKTAAIRALAKSVDETTGEIGGYLLQWGETPPDATFGLDSSSIRKFKMSTDENGLRISFPAGLSIRIR